MISRFSLAAALASLTLLLFACPSPISTDQGPSPISKDLSVTETIPANGATGFDPGQAIVVKFNKDLDPACLPQSPVAIAPNSLYDGSPITLTFSYDNPKKKLSIEPHPFLESNHLYTVSFKTTLQDDSGGTLPKQVDLSFTTGDKLAGDIEIVGGNTYNGKQYTNADKVTLYLRHNSALPVHAHIAKSEAELSTNPLWDEDVSPITNIVDWPLDPNIQGPQTFYAQYLYSSQTSPVRSAVIVYDKVAPVIAPVDIPSYYNMYNDPSKPSSFVAPFVASCSATDPDNTSGIAKYEWHCAGETYNAQSTDVTIDGPDGPYDISLTVTDRAGNESKWPPPPPSQPFTIWKDIDPPGRPPRVPADTDQTSSSPYLYLSGIKWYWLASTTGSNPYDKEDTFRVLLNGAAIVPTSLAPPSFGPITVSSDGLYMLSIEQIDAAGNVSDPRVIPIKVTPVIPDDGSTVVGPTGYLEWRDFSPGAVLPDGWQYWIHIWPDGSDPATAAPISVPKDMRQTPYDFTESHGQKYDWYIIKSLDGIIYEPGNRSPSTEGAFHQFTIQ